MKCLGLFFLLSCAIPLTVLSSDADFDSEFRTDSPYDYYEPVDNLFGEGSTEPIDYQKQLFFINAKKVLHELEAEETDLSQFLFNEFARDDLSQEETKQLLVALIYSWKTADVAIYVPGDPIAYTQNIAHWTSRYQLDGWLRTRFSFMLAKEFFNLFYPPAPVRSTASYSEEGSEEISPRVSPDEDSYDETLPIFTESYLLARGSRTGD